MSLELDHGEMIYRLREVAGMSISELARRSGVSRQTIYKLERGDGVRLRIVASLVRAIGEGGAENPLQSRLYRRSLELIEGASDLGRHSSRETVVDFRDYRRPDSIELVQDLERLAESIKSLQAFGDDALPLELEERLEIASMDIFSKIRDLRRRRESEWELEGKLR